MQNIENAIQNEIDRLQVVFDAIPESQKIIAHSLIERAAFMGVTLKRLEESLNSAELVDEYQNGEAQTGIKQSAELQGYNALIKNYATVMRQLSSMIPKASTAKQTGNGLIELLRQKQAADRGKEDG